MIDLLDPASVAAGLQGCTHVVNCSRGGKEVLAQGLQNLLDASIAAGVERFVHISSVAVYGESATGEIAEDLAPAPAPGTYGAHKLAQDRAVETAVRRGLSAVVLCPPNISGRLSPYLLEIVAALRSRQFALVEGGTLPVELVDVANLVHAMRLALVSTVKGDGQRIFVTDWSGATWKDLVRDLAVLAGQEPACDLDLAEARQRATAGPPPKASIARTARHLLSSAVWEALRKDPLIARTELLGKQAIKQAPAALQDALKRAASGDRRPRTKARGPVVSTQLVRQQLRNVRYSTVRARTVLGYEPVLSGGQSMRGFTQWYGEAYGWDSEWWPLLRQLYS
jgi:nucleoside-diphosphate-sugar epimerase